MIIACGLRIRAICVYYLSSTFVPLLNEAVSSLFIDLHLAPFSSLLASSLLYLRCLVSHPFVLTFLFLSLLCPIFSLVFFHTWFLSCHVPSFPVRFNPFPCLFSFFFSLSILACPFHFLSSSVLGMFFLSFLLSLLRPPY